MSLSLCACTSTHNWLFCPRILYINTPHWRILMHWDCCCVKRWHTQNNMSHKWWFVWLVNQQANQYLLSSWLWILICRCHSNGRNEKGIAILICRCEIDMHSIDGYCWVEILNELGAIPHKRYDAILVQALSISSAWGRICSITNYLFCVDGLCTIAEPLRN